MRLEIISVFPIVVYTLPENCTAIIEYSLIYLFIYARRDARTFVRWTSVRKRSNRCVCTIFGKMPTRRRESATSNGRASHNALIGVPYAPYETTGTNTEYVQPHSTCSGEVVQSRWRESEFMLSIYASLYYDMNIIYVVAHRTCWRRMQDKSNLMQSDNVGVSWSLFTWCESDYDKRKGVVIVSRCRSFVIALYDCLMVFGCMLANHGNIFTYIVYVYATLSTVSSLMRKH